MKLRYIIVDVKCCVLEGSDLKINSEMRKKANTIEQATPTTVRIECDTSERISGVPANSILTSRNPEKTIAIIARNTSDSRIVRLLSSLCNPLDVPVNPAKATAPTTDIVIIPIVTLFVITSADILYSVNIFEHGVNR